MTPGPATVTRSSLYQVHSGLATLGPEALAIREALEKRILGWAREAGAVPMSFPPLLPSAELSRFDYFRNFPHLATVAARIRPDLLAGEYAERAERVAAVPAEHLEEARYLLPSAACYGVYLHLEGQFLAEPVRITTVGTCFRNENGYDELERLWSFSMREVVCVGSAEAVKAHLGDFKTRVTAFAAELDLPLRIEPATDPFYQSQSSTAQLQKLFPQKEEFIFRDSLAIGSLNFHRNFFGERCNIRLADGAPAFTGCVAFGLERWIHALLVGHDHRPDVVLRALEAES